MPTRHYIHKSGAEWEAVDRWENEGGRLSQNYDYILDSISKEYRRHKDQVMQIGRPGKRDQISHVKFFFTGKTVDVDGERNLRQPVFAA